MNEDNNLAPVESTEQQCAWMMDYCKENKLPPAQKWAWDRAKAAYDAYLSNRTQETQELDPITGGYIQKTTS